mmetsp:Transcript_16151/g.51588  ORF Transcript_16151/g.51588 Transcript_16151/m.51588 type:complete len:111 (+) Transcript_16151:767-1099(+)
MFWARRPSLYESLNASPASPACYVFAKRLSGCRQEIERERGRAPLPGKRKREAPAAFLSAPIGCAAQTQVALTAASGPPSLAAAAATASGANAPECGSAAPAFSSLAFAL